MHGIEVRMLVDSGSTVNIIDEVTYDSTQPKPELHKVESKIFSYGSKDALILITTRNLEAGASAKNNKTCAVFFVTKGHNDCLKSY